MTLKISYEGFSVETRWPWEKYGHLQLCVMDTSANEQKIALVKSIESVLAEFQLPLRIEIGNPDTHLSIEGLLTNSSVDGTIDCQKFLETLNHKRQDDCGLQSGLVIAFDGGKRKLWDGPDKVEEPPEWGWSAEDGLMLLRLLPHQPLRNVARHEMGHLLGIGQHHPGCVMDWSCANEDFCPECKQSIRQNLQGSDAGD